MLYKHGRQIVKFLVVKVAGEDQVGSVCAGAEVYRHTEWRQSRRGALCVWPKCFWLRSRRYLVILAGASIVVQPVHFFGSLVGLVGTLILENLDC
jgi:hypothetical protein